MLQQQLGDVQASGLPRAACSFDVVLSAASDRLFDDAVEQTLDEADTFVRSIVPTADVWKYGTNRYEYPGIRRTWDVARSIHANDPSNHLILYFHGKGMVHGPDHDPGRDRSLWNKELTDNVVLRWRDVVRAFDEQPDIQKAGYTVSEDGFPWFNFWWARASHVQSLVRPVVTEDRYYYESWISCVADAGDPTAHTLSPPNTTLTLCPGNAGLKPGFPTFPADPRLMLEQCKPTTHGMLE
jgi:hypothetical protein